VKIVKKVTKTENGYQLHLTDEILCFKCQKPIKKGKLYWVRFISEDGKKDFCAIFCEKCGEEKDESISF